jgi:ATP-binding cassette subfamily B multidrug efflux pump
MARSLFGWFEGLIDPLKPGLGPDLLKPPTTTFRVLYAIVREIGWPIGLLIVISVLVSAIEIAIPWAIGRVVDLVATGDVGTLGDHWLDLVLLVGLLAVARPGITLIASLLRNQTIGRNVGSLVRWRFHEYVSRHDVAFFQNDFVGRIATKVGQTGQAIRSLVRLLADQLLYATLFLAGTLAFLIYRSPLFAIPVVLWLVAYGIMLRVYLPRSRRAARQLAEAGSVFTGRIVDGYSNYLTVRLFSGRDREDDYVREALEETVLRAGEQSRYQTTQTVLLSFLNGLLIASGGVTGVLLWQRGLVSAGDVAAVLALLAQINTLSRMTMNNLGDLYDSVGTLEDSVRSLSKPQEVVDVPSAPPLHVPRGEIVFDHVRFNYDRLGGVPALEDFTITVAPGEKIGLVGPSGAGKSTLVNAFLRLYDLEGGRILVDGQDISTITQDTLRSQVGVVTQDTSLLHRSIRDNIAYGNPGASDEAVRAAAEAARADVFIEGLVDSRGRQGYEAHVGERGVKLSGGQRQRIAIARVLLKNAPILVLDEATSALDSEVEAAIQESLQRLMDGKTVIAIAHRLSTIAKLDRLVVMDHGKVVETGTHGELVLRGGLYARLWARQTGGFIDAGEEADAAE